MRNKNGRSVAFDRPLCVSIRKQMNPDMTLLDLYLDHTKILIYEAPVQSEIDLVAGITVAAG